MGAKTKRKGRRPCKSKHARYREAKATQAHAFIVKGSGWKLEERRTPMELPSLGPGESWYVVKGDTSRLMKIRLLDGQGEETGAAESRIRLGETLKKAGFKVFLPTFTRTRTNICGRKREVAVSYRALFPGYAFVGTAMTHERWNALAAVEGVTSILRSAAGPIQVPERFLARFAVPVNNALKEAATPFAPGDEVRLVEGPLATFLAEVKAIDEQGFVAALVDMFGRKTAVDIHASHLERAA